MKLFALLYPVSLVDTLTWWDQPSLAQVVKGWAGEPGRRFTKVVGLFTSWEAAAQAAEADKAGATYAFDYIILEYRANVLGEGVQ